MTKREVPPIVLPKPNCKYLIKEVESLEQKLMRSWAFKTSGGDTYIQCMECKDLLDYQTRERLHLTPYQTYYVNHRMNIQTSSCFDSECEKVWREYSGYNTIMADHKKDEQ